MDLLIRRPADADLAAIARIYAHAVAHGTASFEVEAPSPDEMRRRWLALAGFPYLVAEAAGEVVGYAYAGPYRPRPAYRGTVEDSVYVAPARQGSGIGRALLTALVEASAEAGFRQMVAVIGDSGSAGSIALHAGLGFRHVGVLEAVGFKHGRWLDVVLMQRMLGPGSAMPLDGS